MRPSRPASAGPRERRGRPRRSLWRAAAIVTIGLALVAVACLVAFARPPRQPAAPSALPTATASYLGLYAPGVPQSLSGLDSFTKSTGVRPNLVSYYSGWGEPFWTSFAVRAREHHAVPLVQIDPTGISVAAIASGRYARYLTAYAHEVGAYGQPVILSFGHEMNGDWYSWAYRHTSPAVFVAAWRYIVDTFRNAGVRNVTWLWTVNAIQPKPHLVPSPAAWWPGRSYVTWVGMDGYFLRPSAQFATVFGPTVAAVRRLTRDPILISESAAVPAAGQPAKIADLFAGIRTYDLLGFVWFNARTDNDYRIRSPAAIAAFRRGAGTLGRLAR
jgi:mannan endo-1,4-beta-mannosidase